ncbi:MAG: ArsR family transcriptional regulator [Sphingobium sp.]
MTALIPPDRDLPNQEAVDLVIALQRCLNNFHARADEPAILADDARLEALSRYIEARRSRHMLFGQGLFADPAWDILLLLLQAELGGRPMTLDQLSEMARLSTPAALGHIGALERRGILLGQSGPPAGGRRRVELSPLAIDGLMSWLYLAFGTDSGMAGEQAA